MAILTLDKVSLAFGNSQLLDKISLGIDSGEKIGLIGRNGTGKSSLFKLLSTKILPDDGKIHVKDGTTIYYVQQEPEFNPNKTIYEMVLTGLGNIEQLFIDYYAILDQLEHNHSEEQLNALNEIQHQLDHANAWQVKNLIDKTLAMLQLDGKLKIKTLSGGMKKKVALAQALIIKPDILLLDEPTNHLDISTITWLEEEIKKYLGTIVLITHDRFFLDNTVNKIFELDRGKINVFPGSFTKYKEYKAIQLAVEEKMNNEFDKFLSQEEVWIRKGIEARRTRNEGRVKRLEQLRIELQNRRNKVGLVNFTVDSGKTSGKIVAKLDNININFANKIILKDFNATIMRGDKIGIIGDNGVGKSTLLKIILNQLQPDSGFVTLGTKLEIAYFDQLRNQLDEEATIADMVSQGQDYVEINGRRTHIASYLEDFLFEPKRFNSQVKSLSGGERNRLLLARMFSKAANVIVLDEPTNDLDIETLELLEELLTNYSGTVFLVSHDRNFLDNVVTQSFVFTGNGEVLEIIGGYTDYINYSKSLQFN
ncbi:MAG: ATP-binding cassette domain-containing protein, partial [Burkholderiales bacterium]|nr:ATP-binding cassette domain-containing protein [Burkholderiales bacterium]